MRSINSLLLTYLLTRQCTLSELLLSAEAVAASHQVTVGGRRQDTGAGICVVHTINVMLTQLEFYIIYFHVNGHYALDKIKPILAICYFFH